MNKAMFQWLNVSILSKLVVPCMAFFAIDIQDRNLVLMEKIGVLILLTMMLAQAMSFIHSIFQIIVQTGIRFLSSITGLHFLFAAVEQLHTGAIDAQNHIISYVWLFYLFMGFLWLNQSMNHNGQMVYAETQSLNGAGYFAKKIGNLTKPIKDERTKSDWNVVATHEAGHLLVLACMNIQDHPNLIASIEADGDKGGYEISPKCMNLLKTQEYKRFNMNMNLAGMVAVEYLMGQKYSGNTQDLANFKQNARFWHENFLERPPTAQQVRRDLYEFFEVNHQKLVQMRNLLLEKHTINIQQDVDYTGIKFTAYVKPLDDKDWTSAN